MTEQKRSNEDISMSQFNEKNYDELREEIIAIRVQLDMTQKEFAEAICLSRASINRFEAGGEFTHDIAFRLYYALDKISENSYIEKSLAQKCKDLKKLLETDIILTKNNCKYNAISYRNYIAEKEI